jgi:hypothetical protein
MLKRNWGLSVLSAFFDPETRNLTPFERVGNEDAGASAMIKEPVIAVVEVPLLPDTVPTSANVISSS